MNRRPVVVLIADVHYNINTLPLADAAVIQAINKANELGVPLIVAGDLHDTKANLRGECVNAMLSTFSKAEIRHWILVGNHCLINERSDQNAINFLSGVADIVRAPCRVTTYPDQTLYLIPYHSDRDELAAYLKTIPKGSTLIMHQGLEGSNMGDYVQDKSALPKECFQDFRVISGHYHARQDIKCGRPRKGAVGLFSYIGNPFTLGFGEANDPSKGFQILYSDGTLEHVPTNLRKHVVIEHNVNDGNATMPIEGLAPNDLVWVKVHGTKEQLNHYSRHDVADIFELEDHPFRLDLIPTDTKTSQVSNDTNKPQSEVLDSLIDSISNTSNERKERIKKLWKGLAV